VIVNISGHAAVSRTWSAPQAPAKPTILLVDDDPLQAFVRKAILLRRFDNVERVASPADAFILVEQPAYAEKLGLVIVGLHLPGMGGPGFVSELTARLPFVHVLVLGGSTEKPTDYCGENVRYLPKSMAAENLLPKCRQMLDRRIPRTA
jgi:CheY-like chemotaxis protein